jgi:GT2 family glycosyltransferase
VHVIIGMLAKDRAWVLPEWFASVWSQQVDGEVEIVSLVSPSEDDTEQIIIDQGVHVIKDDRPGRTTMEVDGHLWGSMETYEYMADIQNQLVDYACEQHCDYFFSLDSDIILPPNAIQNLINYMEAGHPGVAAPAVNLAVGEVAWNTMTWVHRDFPYMATRDVGTPVEGPADVVLAAMMMDRQGMRCRYEAHQQAHDVGFCVRADEMLIPRWWVPQIRCQHLMRRTLL